MKEDCRFYLDGTCTSTRRPEGETPQCNYSGKSPARDCYFCNMSMVTTVSKMDMTVHCGFSLSPREFRTSHDSSNISD